MKSLGFVLAACLACSPAAAANLFVDQARGSDVNDGLSWATARASIGSALSSAASTPEPDIVSVAAGRYVEHLIVPADTTLLGGFPSGGGARDPAANRSVIDGDRRRGTLVTFPPGSDGTTLDGFTVRGAQESNSIAAIGIQVNDAAPLIQGNIVEDNMSYGGGCPGIAVVYSGPRATARLVGNSIRRNVCQGFGCSAASAVDIRAPLGVDLGVIMSGNVVTSNAGGYAVLLSGQGSMENDVIDGNDQGPFLGGSIRLFNVQVTRNGFILDHMPFGPGLVLGCGGSYRLDNVTVALNARGIEAGRSPAGGDLHVENSILWGDGTEVAWNCTGSPAPVIVSSIVQGGYPSGTAIIDADPLFVPGPLDDFYLSQAPAGQPVTSPAVDSGSQPAVTAGLDQRSTATTSAPDAGTVDLGYHHPPVALELLRGATADALAPYRTLSSLPFLDDPGTLSDPTLPTLFYLIPAATNDIGVTKSVATDAVRLDFR